MRRLVESEARDFCSRVGPEVLDTALVLPEWFPNGMPEVGDWSRALTPRGVVRAHSLLLVHGNETTLRVLSDFSAMGLDTDDADTLEDAMRLCEASAGGSVWPPPEIAYAEGEFPNPESSPPLNCLRLTFTSTKVVQSLPCLRESKRRCDG